MTLHTIDTKYRKYSSSFSLNFYIRMIHCQVFKIVYSIQLEHLLFIVFYTTNYQLFPWVLPLNAIFPIVSKAFTFALLSASELSNRNNTVNAFSSKSLT